MEYSSTGPNYQSIPIHPQDWIVGSLTTLANTAELPGICAAFTSALRLNNENRHHRDRLPEEPKEWKSMLLRLHKEGFLIAVAKEIKDLKKKETFKVVETPQATHIMPLKMGLPLQVRLGW